MTSQLTAQERIARSEIRVKEAADSWNAVDLFVISQCLSSLRDSAADLGVAARILKESPAAAASVPPSSIDGLRMAALRLERLVDASAAFLRLTPGPTGDHDWLYQPSGSLCGSTLPPEARGTRV
jgi:hypothetical protein